MTERWCTSRKSFETFEPALHDLWYIYYQVGRNVSHESPEQDRFALDLLRTRGLGPLKRSVQQSGSEEVEIATTPAGILWEDLPFFVADMMDFWVSDFAEMDSTQRVNLTYFFARLVSTSLDHDRLFQIALIVFRDTFETARPLGSLNDTNTDTASIAAFPPSACAWLREAGKNIISLSDASWKDCPDDLGSGGPTFVGSELGQKAKSSAGFSTWRWMYWLKRLDEIAQEAAQAGEEKLEDDAEWTIDVMLGKLEKREWKVLRE